MYYVAKDGRKFPYYHVDYNLHPPNTKRYCNLGDGDLIRNGETIYDLPADGYPYTFEYEKPKIPIWLEKT